MARLPYLDKSDLLPEHQDLLARKSDGTVWLVTGTGATEFSGSFQTAAGWNVFS